MAGRFRFFVRNQPRLLFNNGTNRTKQKSAANNAMESVQKAVKQATEMAEANFNI